jgi:formyltetrahydrofolate-dependent phosphoribosylglycinamide formyltransferase
MIMRVAVAVSGRGSNLAALLEALEGKDSPAQVVLVLSNSKSAGALEIARRHGVRVRVLRDPASPDEWLESLEQAGAALVVLAGYLKLVPAPVVRALRGRMINIHPALLPRHGGPGMYGSKVHEQVLASGDRWTGATVHLVTEDYDRGEILGQSPVAVLPGDTASTLAARVLETEHRLLPAAVLAAARAGKPVSFTLDEDPSRTGRSLATNH